MIFIGYEFNIKWNFRYTKVVEIVQAIIVIILLASAATGMTLDNFNLLRIETNSTKCLNAH